MAENGDKITLAIGNGLKLQNDVMTLTLSKEILKYLGTENERLFNGKDKLILQFDRIEKHRWNFIGFGLKRD